MTDHGDFGGLGDMGGLGDTAGLGDTGGLGDTDRPDGVQLTLDETVVRCGGVVRGSCTWSTSRNPRSVQVTLRYETDGRGDTDRLDVSVATLGTTKQGTERFEFPVPIDGPISYVGDLITINWEVRAHIDLAGRRDPDAEVAIVVTPA